MAQTRILLGVIGRPHGVRGLVHVVSYADDPASLVAYGPLSDDKGRRLRLAWRAEGIAAVTLLSDAGPVAVADRDAAAALVNTRLYVERDRLPPPAEDEYYVTDLIGLAAEDEAGLPLGSVRTVHDYGAGVSLEIAADGAPPLLVPFTRAAVPMVDLAARRLQVCPPRVLAASAEDAARGTALDAARGAVGDAGADAAEDAA